jgi:hypothetical protein
MCDKLTEPMTSIRSIDYDAVGRLRLELERERAGAENLRNAMLEFAQENERLRAQVQKQTQSSNQELRKERVSNEFKSGVIHGLQERLVSLEKRVKAAEHSVLFELPLAEAVGELFRFHNIPNLTFAEYISVCAETTREVMREKMAEIEASGVVEEGDL